MRAGAGALAGVALRPALAIASSPGRLGAIKLGPLRAIRTVELPPRIAVLALAWTGSRHAHPELRVQLRDGSWGPWVPAEAQGHGPDAATATSVGRGEPLWIAAARRVQLRSAVPLAEARLRYVTDPEASLAGVANGPAREAALQLAQPVLAAGAGQPPIIARAVWAEGVPPPRVAPAYGQVELGFVHHTENPNGYSAAQVPAMLRSIYLFHREGNGWNDIGYNFVVDLYGRIWEARAGGIDESVVGAHAGGYNLYSSGIAVLGSFMGTPISAAAHAALQRLLAWKLSLHGVPARGHVTVRVNPAGASYSKYPARARVSLPRIAGHRDADSTDCPGDALYGELPGVRRRVQSLAGSAVLATLALQQPAAAPGSPAAPGSALAPAPGSPGSTTAPGSAPAPASQPTPTSPPQLLIALARLDGTPLAGVPVQVQVRTVARRGLSVTHTTVAEAVTDPTGRCLITATFAVGAAAPIWVRALYGGGPLGGAAVSTPVKIEPVAATQQPPAAAPTA